MRAYVFGAVLVVFRVSCRFTLTVATHPAAMMSAIPSVITQVMSSPKKSQLKSAEKGIAEKPRQDERSIFPEA